MKVEPTSKPEYLTEKIPLVPSAPVKDLPTGIPEGFTQLRDVNVYVKPIPESDRHIIIITGDPPEEKEGVEDDLHNCDYMGCGWEHVLYRLYT